MKNWIKLFISILTLFVFITTCLTSKDIPHLVVWTILVIVPAAIAAFFVYRILKLPKTIKIVVACSISAIATVNSIMNREIIFRVINVITEDSETELFLFYILLFLQIVILTWLTKFVDLEELVKKIKRLPSKNKTH